MKTKSLLWLAVAVVLFGCAKVHLVCPDNGVATAVIGGSQVGYQLIAMGSAMATKGGMMAAAPSGGTSSATSTVDYNWVPIFGQDYASCGEMPAPTAVATPAAGR